MAKKAIVPSPADELDIASTGKPRTGQPGQEVKSRSGPPGSSGGRPRSLWRRISVSLKLIVLMILPVGGLLFFATIGSSVSTSLGELTLDRMAKTEMDYFAGAKNLVIELQKERGISGFFLGNQTEMGVSDLAASRAAVDLKLAEFRGVLETHDPESLRPEFRAVVNAVVNSLATIPDTRQKVDGKRVVAADAVALYSEINNRILYLIGRSNELTPDPRMDMDSRALTALLRATESTAKQRYLVSTGLTYNKLPGPLLSALEGEVRDEQTRIGEFRDFANEESMKQLDAALGDRAVKSADTYRKTVMDSNVQASFGGLTVKTWFDAANKKIEVLFSISAGIEKTIFDTVESRLRKSYVGLMLSAVIVVGVLLAALIPAFMIARGISRPLGQAAEVLRAVADGDFSRQVEVLSSDEVGRLSASVNDMAAQLRKSQLEMTRSQNLVENSPINIMMADRDLKLIYINPASLATFKKLEHLLPCKAHELHGKNIDMFHKNPAHQRKLLSDPKNLPYQTEIQLGPEWLDLSAAAILDKEGNYLGPMVSWTLITDQKKAKDRDLQVQGQISTIATELNQNSTHLVTTSNTMAANAEENSSQANNVSSAAEQVSTNVASVAAAVEEMTATIREVSKTVQKSTEVTRNAVVMSKKASELVTQLGESSNKISQVTKVIASIAQQTNILALNATIEAARAGEAGKGFAVVANEVKELAKNTAKMTEDISTRIAGIQASTGEAVLSIEEINRIMSEVDTLSSTVASAVEEQAATTSEISRSMTEASTGVGEIVKNISGMANAAKDTSKQAIASKEGAEGLGSIASRLQEIVRLFAQVGADAGGGRG